HSDPELPRPPSQSFKSHAPDEVPPSKTGEHDSETQQAAPCRDAGAPRFPRPATAASTTSSNTSGRKRLFSIALLAIAIALGTATYFQSRRLVPATQAQPSRSLAILPLQNLTQDPKSDFLSFSLADALITKLDYISSLSVRPSSAV